MLAPESRGMNCPAVMGKEEPTVPLGSVMVAVAAEAVSAMSRTLKGLVFFAADPEAGTAGVVTEKP